MLDRSVLKCAGLGGGADVAAWVTVGFPISAARGASLRGLVARVPFIE